MLNRLALALPCTVQFVVVLDVAVVNVALPSIQTDLGFSPGDLRWVVSAFALLFGGFLLLGGPRRRPALPPALTDEFRAAFAARPWRRQGWPWRY